MTANKPVTMRINIAGFGGEPLSLFGAYDPATDMLLLQEARALESKERAGFLHVSNMGGESFCDFRFDNEQSGDAIAAYFELSSQGLVKLGDKVLRFDPSNRIERDGMDDSGVKYRIHPDISNGQVAVLVAAAAAARQRKVSAVLEDGEDLMSFF